MILQASLVKDPAVSVNRIIWSLDGTLFGVAYSRHIVQIYSYNGGDDIRQHLEIDAHIGGVNDIAFGFYLAWATQHFHSLCFLNFFLHRHPKEVIEANGYHEFTS
ncbi:protein TPR3 [Zea mays]|uniref:protein TPR3 n=1 Tax=Zea mays TaxID=4577 RepID=UPI0009AA4616|nr:protein TPR3 [Zea mays]|eukprot:XP_020404906.1 protein TPR3 [Zea mays]